MGKWEARMRDEGVELLLVRFALPLSLLLLGLVVWC